MSARKTGDAQRVRIPFLLGAALCFWGIGAALLESGRTSPRSAFAMAFVLSSTAVLLGVATLVIYRFVRCRKTDEVNNLVLFKINQWLSLYYLKVIFTLILALCAIASSCAALERLHRDAGSTECLSEETAIVLTSDARPSSWSDTAWGYVPSRRSRAKVVLPKRSGLLYGDRLTGIGSFSPIDFTDDASAWSAGASCVVRMRETKLEPDCYPWAAIGRMRRDSIERLKEQGEASAVVQSIICGYRGDLLETEAGEDFKTCGLAHMVAVSGAHLAMVAGMITVAMRRLRLPRALGTVLLIGVLLAYLVFSAAPVSAVRATVMCVLATASFFARRRPACLQALALVIIGCLALDPLSSLSASFALSVLSTLGIVLFQGSLAAAIRRFAPFFPGAAAEAIALSLSANLLSLPLSIHLFSRISLVFLLSNVAAAPFFPAICACGLLACIVSEALPALSGWAFAPSLFFCGLLIRALSLLSQIPYASIPFWLSSLEALAATLVPATAFYLFRPRLTKGHVIAVLAALLAFSVFTVTWPPHWFCSRIVMLDVGQGDSFLLIGRGKTMLIDTGRSDASLVRGLARNHVGHLDAVVITHADDDHCGSLDALGRVAEIDRVVLARGADECSEKKVENLVETARHVSDEVSYVAAGDSMSLGTFSMKVVWPHRLEHDYGNADSVCLDVRCDADSDGCSDCRVLFTGDLESDQLSAIVEEGVRGIDVLKVCHHGSDFGLDEASARALTPRLSLVSVGKDNRYGHPSKRVLSLLEDTGSVIMRTDLSGEVSCEITASGLKVAAQR